MTTELNIGGVDYQVGSMDAFSQLHVARKLSPAMPILEPLLADRNAGKDVTLLVVILMSRLTDEETEYVIEKCLSVVSRKQDKGWAKIRANGVMMFQDTSMAAVVQLTAAAIAENLGDFFRTALANLAAQKQGDS
jgi:hypothetical protein